ncbi:hypothetical protein [Hymenobacter cavernae]|uniref:DUF1828 domain-containing protein n=1 Tax=Hymenobacter cavernae TaxID=2044852 RepID=A0ABQ1UGE9_9BACT|nr:hypothetical protein [Hymenobacter cavernae]GGF18514.1 hypothetical protein GCM10011383_32500 [Hymenobacter cavernae]
MTRNWNDIKWIFEPDGSLIDIYVQDVTLRKWERLIDFLNTNYDLRFGEDDSNQINKEHVVKYLSDATGEIEAKTLKIYLEGINVHCYFFLSDQIEFDIDPKEINSLIDFESIEYFMISISKLLNSQVTLTGESTPEFPLLKVDFNKNINKILTIDEANKLRENKNSFLSQLSLLKTKLQMKFFPNAFKDRLLRSANEVYTSIGKDKNVW